jgi:hypothetical protein
VLAHRVDDAARHYEVTDEFDFSADESVARGHP